MTSPRPRSNILEMSAYVPSDNALVGVSKPIHLASNESPIGPSALAIDAARTAMDQVHLYPDALSTNLASAIAAHHNISPNWILCGTGSESLIEVICRTYAGPGDEVLMPQHAFPMFSIYARAAGAHVVFAEAPRFTADVSALLARVNDRTRVIFIANPNNPTGTYIDGAQLDQLVNHLPDHLLLVIDSAYAEYVDDDTYDDGLIHVTRRPANVIMLRTFSKLYALAGLRVGWMYASPEIISYVLRARFVYPVTTPAQAAAVAALQDGDHLRRSKAHNTQWKTWLQGELRALGIPTLPAGGNFILAQFEADALRSANTHLRSNGIIVRMIEAVGGLRMTIGTEPENRALIDTFKSWRGQCDSI